MNDFNKQIKLTDKLVEELNILYSTADVTANCNHVSYFDYNKLLLLLSVVL